MPRAVCYFRVSTDEQVDTRAGLNAQRDACAAWCAREGYEAVGPFEEVEGVSGSTPLEKRAALLRAVAALAPGDVLLVAKRDRLARDLMVSAMLEASVRKKRCRVVSAAGEGTDDDSPTSILLRRMIDLFSEHERLIIGLRTTVALQAKRKRRERTGRVPYGSDLIDDGRRSKTGGLPIALVDAPTELRVLKRMMALARDGWSSRRIAWALNRAGRTTKAGRPWAHSSVHHLLRRWASDPDALALLERLPDDDDERDPTTDPIPQAQADSARAPGGPAP